MSWTPIDEWREQQAEERREREEALLGTPCMGCFYSDKCDYAHDYENCEMCEYDDEDDGEDW